MGRQQKCCSCSCTLCHNVASTMPHYHTTLGLCARPHMPGCCHGQVVPGTCTWFEDTRHTGHGGAHVPMAPHACRAASVAPRTFVQTYDGELCLWGSWQWLAMHPATPGQVEVLQHPLGEPGHHHPTMVPCPPQAPHHTPMHLASIASISHTMGGTSNLLGTHRGHLPLYSIFPCSTCYAQACVSKSSPNQPTCSREFHPETPGGCVWACRALVCVIW